MPMNTVWIALPARPGENMSVDLWRATQRDNMGPGFTLIDARAQGMSLLTTNFNNLWCAALNMKPRPDRFLMVHSDVCPESGRWVSDLLIEMEKHDADVLSGVITLKDDHGLTSTAIMNWRAQNMKVFSIRECLGFPTTFSAQSAGYDAGHALLVNTGLLLVDFTKPWVEKMCFRIYDTIVKRANGEFQAIAVGEDYLFSMDCFRLGLRVYATTKVKVMHHGLYRYPNAVAWGSEEGAKEAEKWDRPWCTEPPFHWQDDPELKHLHGLALKNTPNFQAGTSQIEFPGGFQKPKAQP